MSFELVYTSAPAGLNPGNSGFCTVAVTAGLSKMIISKLEMLSGYEFLYNISSDNAHLNPVNYAHTTIAIGSEHRSVLSRIAFSGADYTGRVNKIAHHLLLDTTEILDIGPAHLLTLLENKSIFYTSWQSKPKELPERRLNNLIDNQQERTISCKHWENITGDAGWAGKFIQAFYEKRKVPCYLIFKPGQDVLALFKECVNLLPDNLKWQINFATYYTALPAGCFYNWRGVLADSAASKEIARHPTAMVVDITGVLPAPEDNPYVQSARQGKVFELKSVITVKKPEDTVVKKLAPVKKEEKDFTIKPAIAQPRLLPRAMLSHGKSIDKNRNSKSSTNWPKIIIISLSCLVGILLLVVTILLVKPFKMADSSQLVPSKNTDVNNGAPNLSSKGGQADVNQGQSPAKAQADVNSQPQPNAAEEKIDSSVPKMQNQTKAESSALPQATKVNVQLIERDELFNKYKNILKKDPIWCGKQGQRKFNLPMKPCFFVNVPQGLPKGLVYTVIDSNTLSIAHISLNGGPQNQNLVSATIDSNNQLICSPDPVVKKNEYYQSVFIALVIEVADQNMVVRCPMRDGTVEPQKYLFNATDRKITHKGIQVDNPFLKTWHLPLTLASNTEQCFSIDANATDAKLLLLSCTTVNKMEDNYKAITIIDKDIQKLELNGIYRNGKRLNDQIEGLKKKIADPNEKKISADEQNKKLAKYQSDLDAFNMKNNSEFPKIQKKIEDLIAKKQVPEQDNKTLTDELHGLIKNPLIIEDAWDVNVLNIEFEYINSEPVLRTSL